MIGDSSELAANPQQLHALFALLDVTRELAMHQSLEQVLQSVTATACESLRCERASLFLYDESRRELYTRAVTELEIAEIRTSVEQGITGWVASHRELLNIAAPAADARWNSQFDQQTGFHTRNILAAPILAGPDGRLIGVLELINKIDGTFDGFDEQLIRAFAAHAASALERGRLADEARASHELVTAVNMGRRIQTSFLPRSLPHIPGYKVATWWRPAESVSGDYYDIVSLPNGRVGLVMGDVSGHGIGPSLLMASVRAMVHVLARTRSDPGEILSLLAETIAPDLEHGRFLTFLFVALDPRTHEIQFANAGHGPALLFHRQSSTFETIGSTSLPLGFLSDFTPRKGNSLAMQSGDLLILATDGLIELQNDERAIFGRRRLEAFLREHANLIAGDLVMAIQDEISEFLGDSEPNDDITLMIVERKLSQDK